MDASGVKITRHITRTGRPFLRIADQHGERFEVYMHFVGEHIELHYNRDPAELERWLVDAIKRESRLFRVDLNKGYTISDMYRVNGRKHGNDSSGRGKEAPQAHFGGFSTNNQVNMYR